MLYRRVAVLCPCTTLTLRNCYCDEQTLQVGIISLLLILLMVYAALAKLNDYDNFRFGLSESPIIAPFAGILVWAVPATELLIAAMLALSFLRLAGLYASFVLMLLFTLYIVVMLSFYDHIPCSCGGCIGRDVVGRAHWFQPIRVAQRLGHQAGKKAPTTAAGTALLSSAASCIELIKLLSPGILSVKADDHQSALLLSTFTIHKTVHH